MSQRGRGPGENHEILQTGGELHHEFLARGGDRHPFPTWQALSPGVLMLLIIPVWVFLPGPPKFDRLGPVQRGRSRTQTGPAVHVAHGPRAPFGVELQNSYGALEL